MPELFIGLFVLALFVAQILLYVTTACIAHRKGYRWCFWIFVGNGLLGLPLMLLLPAANQPGLALKTQQQQRQKGNLLGAVLTCLTYVFVLWYRSRR